jgi:hypothetical protein
MVTSEMLWTDAVCIALVDVAFVLILNRCVKPSGFRRLKWSLAGAAAVFWGLFCLILVEALWNTYYRYFYPDWLGPGGVLLSAPVLGGVLALAFRWLALRAPGNPILAFCLVAGLESMLEHLWGIYGMRILDVPMLRSASAAAVLAFAFPEYLLYWCVVIAGAAVCQGVWQRGTDRRRGVRAA